MKNMTKLPYCSKCGKEVQYDVLTEENQINLDSKATVFVTIPLKVARCKECGEEVFVRKISEENDNYILLEKYLIKLRLKDDLKFDFRRKLRYNFYSKLGGTL